MVGLYSLFDYKEGARGGFHFPKSLIPSGAESIDWELIIRNLHNEWHQTFTGNLKNIKRKTINMPLR